MYNSSVTKRFLISVTMLVATAVPGISSAGEQSSETGNVVGSAVEVSNMLEISNVVTSNEVVISQEDEKRGEVRPPEVGR